MTNIIKLFELCREAAKSTLGKAVKAEEAEIVKSLQDVLMRIDRGPVRAIIFGETSSGKSTIINALTGQITVPEADHVSTAVPTYIMGNVAPVGRDNIVYRQTNFTADGSLSDKNMARNDFLINGNYDSTHTDPELEIFMAADSPHYRAVLGNREMEEHCISVIDTPGTNAGDSDTEKLFRELNGGFELLIFTMKSFNILEPDQEVISRLLPLLKDNGYFDKSCLFTISNDFSDTAYLSEDLKEEQRRANLLATGADVGKCFKEYSDVKDHLYCFSAICARLQRAKSIYHFTAYLPKNFSDGQYESARLRQDQETEILTMVEDEPLEADFVRFKNDLFAQAKKIGSDPAFITDTVGSLFDRVSQSADKLRESEIIAVDGRYSYNPDGELPDFGREELKELSNRKNDLWQLEKRLPGTDDSLTVLTDRIGEIEAMGIANPGLIGSCVRELIGAIGNWNEAEDILGKPDFGDAELLWLSAAIKDAKVLLEDYRAMGDLFEGGISFEQTAREFLNSHSYSSCYNCSKEEIWYCEGNSGQMNSWFLERVDTDTLSLIYEKIWQDYRKLFETIINDLEKSLMDDLNKIDVSALAATQYYTYNEYIYRVNSFMNTYAQDSRYKEFAPIYKLNRPVDVSGLNGMEPSPQDFIDELKAFVNSKVPVMRQDKGFFKKVQATLARAIFGNQCVNKIASFFDGAAKKYVNEYYQKFQDNILCVLRKNADDYIAAMTGPKNDINKILDEFEHAHEQMSLSARRKLEADAKDLKEKCSDAIKRLQECVAHQKDEVMRQYSDGVKSVTDELHAQINDRYSDIDNALNEVSRELKELETAI